MMLTLKNNCYFLIFKKVSSHKTIKNVVELFILGKFHTVGIILNKKNQSKSVF